MFNKTLFLLLQNKYICKSSPKHYNTNLESTYRFAFKYLAFPIHKLCNMMSITFHFNDLFFFSFLSDPFPLNSKLILLLKCQALRTWHRFCRRFNNIFYFTFHLNCLIFFQCNTEVKVDLIFRIFQFSSNVFFSFLNYIIIFFVAVIVNLVCKYLKTYQSNSAKTQLLRP